jgi:hypothetical protein
MFLPLFMPFQVIITLLQLILGKKTNPFPLLFIDPFGIEIKGEERVASFLHVGQFLDFVPHIHIEISIPLSKRKEILSLGQGLIILNEEKMKIKSSRRIVMHSLKWGRGDFSLPARSASAEAGRPVERPRLNRDPTQ